MFIVKMWQISNILYTRQWKIARYQSINEARFCQYVVFMLDYTVCVLFFKLLTVALREEIIWVMMKTEQSLNCYFFNVRSIPCIQLVSFYIKPILRNLYKICANEERICVFFVVNFSNIREIEFLKDNSVQKFETSSILYPQIKAYYNILMQYFILERFIKIIKQKIYFTDILY